MRIFVFFIVYIIFLLPAYADQDQEVYAILDKTPQKQAQKENNVDFLKDKDPKIDQKISNFTPSEPIFPKSQTNNFSDPTFDGKNFDVDTVFQQDPSLDFGLSRNYKNGTNAQFAPQIEDKNNPKIDPFIQKLMDKNNRRVDRRTDNR